MATLTIPKLKDILRERGVRGYSNKSKAELVRMVIESGGLEEGPLQELTGEIRPLPAPITAPTDETVITTPVIPAPPPISPAPQRTMVDGNRVTIPRVSQTPKVPYETRGRKVMIEQPEIGSIVLRRDSGYAASTGYRNPYVVITTSKTRDGFVNSATISPIVDITDTTVTYDRTAQTLTLKPYFSVKEGDTWNTEAKYRMYDYQWDHYEPAYEGQWK